jgi:hypothetical protein
MMMKPAVRKVALMIHVTCSVAWIGAVLAFMALVIIAINSSATTSLLACWIAMRLIGWYVIVPLALISLLSGIIMSLGTKWGLFRHYWVLISLALTILATLVLLVNMQTVNVFGLMAETNSEQLASLRAGLNSEVLHSGIGLVVLLLIQWLNMVKPRGLTPYGWRKQQEERKLQSFIEAEVSPSS